MKSNKQTKLYTSVAEYDGTTLVEQYRATDLHDFLDQWLARTQAPISKRNISDHHFDFAAIGGSENVWCSSILDDKEVLYTIHVVLTTEAS